MRGAAVGRGAGRGAVRKWVARRAQGSGNHEVVVRNLGVVVPTSPVMRPRACPMYLVLWAMVGRKLNSELTCGRLPRPPVALR